MLSCRQSSSGFSGAPGRFHPPPPPSQEEEEAHYWHCTLSIVQDYKYLVGGNPYIREKINKTYRFPEAHQQHSKNEGSKNGRKLSWEAVRKRKTKKTSVSSCLLWYFLFLCREVKKKELTISLISNSWRYSIPQVRILRSADGSRNSSSLLIKSL